MARMTTAATPIYYPESDGKPMGETDVHIDALIYLREALRDYCRDDPQVYVAGNMLLHYEAGNPEAWNCGWRRAACGWSTRRPASAC